MNTVGVCCLPQSIGHSRRWVQHWCLSTLRAARLQRYPLHEVSHRVLMGAPDVFCHIIPYSCVMNHASSLSSARLHVLLSADLGSRFFDTRTFLLCSISQKKITTVSFNNSGEWIAFGCARLGQLLVWEWQSETCVLRQQVCTLTREQCHGPRCPYLG